MKIEIELGPNLSRAFADRLQEVNDIVKPFAEKIVQALEEKDRQIFSKIVERQHQQAETCYLLFGTQKK